VGRRVFPVPLSWTKLNDIARSVRVCARQSHNPSPRHWKALLQNTLILITRRHPIINYRSSVSGTAVMLGKGVLARVMAFVPKLFLKFPELTLGLAQSETDARIDHAFFYGTM